MVKHTTKRGDTLVEVMLAVGIFSLVAISIVAVMSGSTSSAQTSLEATLAREEIDTQAEALRFIHSSYIADSKNSETESPYKDIWGAIKNRAIKPGSLDSNYPPTECKAIYEDDYLENQNAFVINYRNLKDGGAYVPSGAGSTGLFGVASTYPRIVYESDTELINDNDPKINSVEGIYVTAVKGNDGGDPGGDPDFYDFYIRTCWYGSGERTASTISTVIRLINPEIVINQN